MDAMSGQGRLGDQGRVADLYGLGRLGRIHDWVEYTTRRNTGRAGLGREGRRGADWADRLGRGRLGRPASSHLRAEGIRDMLSPDADCGVIWLHTPGIHVRFFRAHIVVIFLETDTSKVQRASPGDKFFDLLGALNIIYSMFIQMGHAIRDVVNITYKRGLLSFASLHLLLFLDVVVPVEHLNVKFHEADWMGYSAALPRSVWHLLMEKSKALQSSLQSLFVLRCQLRILIHIHQRWMRIETSKLQYPCCQEWFQKTVEGT